MKDNGAEDLKTVVVYSGLGLGIVTGAFLLARHFVKKSQKNNAEKSSATEGNPTAYAKQLHMAFQNDNYFGWGTNLSLLMQVFSAMPNKKTYEKVQKAYSDLYNKNLNADLEDELSSEEYNSVIRILAAKR